jgi:hypothetical protein
MSSAPLSALLASLTLTFVLGFSLSAQAQEPADAAETLSTASEEKKPEQPGVDVWQYLASPFGDPPALSSATTPSTTTATTIAAPERKWPEEYWNCLLLNLRGMGSDLATRLIAKACQEKYPQQ